MTRPHALTLTRNCGVDKFLPPRMSCDVTKPLRCLGVMLARLVGRALGGAFSCSARLAAGKRCSLKVRFWRG
jgi:hypothetical protein